MKVIRQIYESAPDAINVPPELCHRHIEVIFLPLDEIEAKDDGTGQPDEGVEKFFGSIPDFPERELQGTDKTALLREIAESMKANSFTGDPPKFTREELHDRR